MHKNYPSGYEPPDKSAGSYKKQTAGSNLPSGFTPHTEEMKRNAKALDKEVETLRHERRSDRQNAEKMEDRVKRALGFGPDFQGQPLPATVRPVETDKGARKPTDADAKAIAKAMRQNEDESLLPTRSPTVGKNGGAPHPFQLSNGVKDTVDKIIEGTRIVQFDFVKGNHRFTHHAAMVPLTENADRDLRSGIHLTGEKAKNVLMVDHTTQTWCRLDEYPAQASANAKVLAERGHVILDLKAKAFVSPMKWAESLVKANAHMRPVDSVTHADPTRDGRRAPDDQHRQWKELRRDLAGEQALHDSPSYPTPSPHDRTRARQGPERH